MAYDRKSQKWQLSKVAEPVQTKGPSEMSRNHFGIVHMSLAYHC